MHIDSLLGRVAGGDSLSMEEMSAAIDSIMQGGWSEAQIGLLLTGLAAKGETVAEIAGAAAAMRRHMTRIHVDRTPLVDTCGTGGSGSRKFNISTAAAIATAACGVAVAKHGNRSITSKSGSADVLAELGVNIQASVPQVERCLAELGIGFCFAQLHHPAMKHVMPVRKKLGVPTIFNVLGPLCNPAGAPFQVLGVGRAELRPKLAGALALLGTERAFVLWGSDGLDEITLGGPTQVTEVVAGRLIEHTWNPADFGVQPAAMSTLTIDNPAESAAFIRGVLEAQLGPPRDIVLANTAAALVVCGRVATLLEGVLLAAEAIDGGHAMKVLQQLARISHEPTR